MPTGEKLVRMFPRSWRERYGEEFIATMGGEALRPRQVFDIIMAAIDARLSADVRNTTRTYRMAGNGGGGLPMLKSMIICDRTNYKVTSRDGLIGAGVMLGMTLGLSMLGIALRRSGWPVTGEILKGFAFPGSLVSSMPFWVMKCQPWKAQAVIIGATLLILLAITYLATKI